MGRKILWEKRSNPSKNKIKYVFSLLITIIGLLSLFVGTSYAILRGIDTSSNDQVIKAGSVELKLTEKFENIDKKITIMSDVDGLIQETTYDFNLKNIGSEPAKFDIKLVNEVPSSYTGEVLSLDYFKVGLEINGEEHGPMSLREVNGIIDSDIIYKGEIINYKMRIWLDEEKSEELKAMEDYKAFLKLEVEAEQRVEEMDQGIESPILFSYTGDVQEYEVMRDGYYKIEAWGAQGGSYNNTYYGGNGSYTSGDVYLETGEKLYIYVGEQPVATSTSANYTRGGYNGGGNSGYNSSTDYSRGGGGATDVRLVKGNWNDIKSLRSRIIVAAGGGGSVYNSSYKLIGANGGGLTGYAGVSSYSTTAPSGGTQTSYGTGHHTTSARLAGFGYGGGAETVGTNTGWGGGGGSGYYGGALGHGFPGAGGSSYISGHTGCVAVTSQDDTTPKSGCTTGTSDNSCSVHYSNKKFTNTVMIDGSGYTWTNVKSGNKKMPNPVDLDSNYSAGEGHTGNGYARITYLDYEKEKQYSYTGDVQEYKVPKDGYYYVELSGAAGGPGHKDGVNTMNFGLGAKTSGYIYLRANEKLYIYVGGQGGVPTTKTCSNSTHAELSGTGGSGGYNGGGAGGNDGCSTANSANDAAGGGGGATDIRLVGGSWDSAESLISRIMVAGGGGGGTYSNYAGSGSYLYGQDAYFNSSSAAILAAEPMQNSGYAFGKGGPGKYCTSNEGSGGHGGGYYGGQITVSCSYGEGGTGGSSYISGYAGVNSVEDSTTITHTAQTLHYSKKYFIGGKMQEGINAGNGYAKIKYVGAKPERKSKKLDGVRYIKDCINTRMGNSCANCRNWVEIQAIKDGINIAKGKTVTNNIATDSDFSSTSSGSTMVNITDGLVNKGAVNSKQSGDQCIIVDLGHKYELDEVAAFHTMTPWIFLNHSLSVSSDNNNWTEIIDDIQVETSNGKRVNAYEHLYNGYIEDGLVLWYDAENNYSALGSSETGYAHFNSATTWRNLVSSSYSGTVTGATWAKDYISFDGVDDSVKSSALNLASPTIEVVFNKPGFTASTEEVMLGNFESGGYGVTYINQKLEGEFYINSAYRTVGAPVRLNKYETLSTSYDKSVIKVYSNGNFYDKLDIVGTIGNPASSTVFAIGGNPVGSSVTTGYFKGKISSVRIYNRPLTDEEVNHNYLVDVEKFDLK